MHINNSLNNRFQNLTPIATEVKELFLALYQSICHLNSFCLGILFKISQFCSYKFLLFPCRLNPCIDMMGKYNISLADALPFIAWNRLSCLSMMTLLLTVRHWRVRCRSGCQIKGPWWGSLREWQHMTSSQVILAVRNLEMLSPYSESFTHILPVACLIQSLGQRNYLRWQHTWWSGTYSIILTKASLLHRDYLKVSLSLRNFW